MMAAAQPFLSGAISKTVNMPEDATVEDIMNTYVEGWKLGLKAVAIYRDGSKRSAPLNTRKTTGMGGAGADDDHATRRTCSRPRNSPNWPRRTKRCASGLTHPCASRMPETRMSLTHKFEIAGHEGYLTVGFYRGRHKPGELFIQMSKEGSTIGGLMDTVATLTSIALQYGVPLESSSTNSPIQRFEPSGFTKNPDIRTAFSITDYVFRWLGCQFIQGYREATSPDYGQEELPMPEIAEMEQTALNRPVRDLPVVSEQARVKRALGTAYMGILCSHCGSDKVIRAGACGVCTQCGTSQGCS